MKPLVQPLNIKAKRSWKSSQILITTRNDWFYLYDISRFLDMVSRFKWQRHILFLAEAIGWRFSTTHSCHVCAEVAFNRNIMKLKSSSIPLRKSACLEVVMLSCRPCVWWQKFVSLLRCVSTALHALQCHLADVVFSSEKKKSAIFFRVNRLPWLRNEGFLVGGYWSEGSYWGALLWWKSKSSAKRVINIIFTADCGWIKPLLNCEQLSWYCPLRKLILN